MNLYLKYGPLAYTLNTRINGPLNKICIYAGSQFLGKCVNVLLYLGNLILNGITTLLFLFLLGIIEKNIFLFSIFLYIYLIVVFIVFYEIGYIFNDVYCSKKEKNPKLYVQNKYTNKFWIIQVIIRLILGAILLIPLYYKSLLFYSFLILIFIMGIVFFIHNYFRNYNINMFTMQLLRLLKAVIFIIVIKSLGLQIYEVSQIIYPFLIFQGFLLFNEGWNTYNDRLGGQNVKNFYGYGYIFISIELILFLIFTRNIFFIIPIIILIPKIIYFIKNKPPYSLYDRNI